MAQWAFLFMFGICMAASAHGYTQDKISLRLEKVKMNNALSSLQKQTKVKLLYSEDLFSRYSRISIVADNQSFKEVLQEILFGTNLTYKVIDSDLVAIVPVPAYLYYRSEITGIVKDESGKPLDNVTIVEKGTTNGTTTDSLGRFSLSVKDANAVLVVSMIGYESREVAVENLKYFDISLKPIAANLNEVIIVGYGTQRKKDVTGAIASIGQKDLRQSPVANISNALAGRLPGLVTIQNSGEPGADGSALYIRGLGTTGSNDPLVLVDGIQRDFTSLDPNEISDITILKDAASTAIYGIRGANGVILVTTRRGADEKPSISVTAQNGWQSPTRLPQYANAYDGLTLFREGLVNDGLSTTQYTDSILNLHKDRSMPAYQYLYPDVDWLQTMLKPYSLMSQANLNVNGGNSFAKYFVSMSYLRQNGLYNFADQIKQYSLQAITNKYNFRSNIDLQISKDLTMELNLGAIVRDRNYPTAGASNLFQAMEQTPSWYMPLTNPDGSVPGILASGESPYGLLVNSGYQRFFETSLQSTAGFKWDMNKLLKGLSSRVRLSFDNVNYRNVTRQFDGSYYQYSLNDGIRADTATDLATDGHYTTLHQGSNTLDYSVGANGTRRTTLELYLNYDKSFGKNSIHAVAVYNQSSYFADVSGGQANAVAGLPYKYDGLVGRISYNYDNKYLLELNAGYNGSENFMAGHRLGFFPAVSAGWVLSKEKFISDNPALYFIDNLKIRGSYGIVGNDQLGGNRFLYLSTWTITGGGYTFGANRDGNSYSGAYESQSGNPAITWEKSKNANIGMDISLWNESLSITADYFKNHRVNVLLTSQLIPSALGLTSTPPVNGGVINNHGYEISIGHKKNFNKQGYEIRINASYFRNKIMSYAEPVYTGREWQARTGTEIGEQWGYVAEGLFKSQEDVDTSADQSGFGAVQPGDIKYKDLNGDGKINSTDAGYLKNKVSLPRYILGLSLSYHYASFDISAFLQAGLGGTVMATGNGIFPFSRLSGVLEDVINNHWVASDPDKNYAFPRISSQDNPNNQQSSTFWLKSSNYLRLKTFEIGYSFPSSMLKRIGFSKTRIFLNGINMITWDKLKIFDPEIANGTTGTYPQQKVVNAGLTFSF